MRQLGKLLVVSLMAAVAAAAVVAGSAPAGAHDPAARRPTTTSFGATTRPGAWVADHHGGTISKIDPRTNTVVASVPVGLTGSSGPQGIAAGLGSVWVDVPNSGTVVRVDPATDTVQATIKVPVEMQPCGGIAVGQTVVWVTSCLEQRLVARIDPAANKVASILDVGGKVVQPAADGDSVWFVAGGDPDLAPTTASLLELGADDSVKARYALQKGFISGGAAVAFGSVWISDWLKPLVLRIPDGG